MSTLALNCRLARTRTGLSQERLSQLSGVDRAVISTIENERGNPTHATICALAAALAVRPAWPYPTWLYTEHPR